MYNHQKYNIQFFLGDDTLYGKLAHLNTENEEYSYLGGNINNFIKKISASGIVFGIFFFIISFINGYGWVQSTEFAMGIVIAQVPECLMTSIAISLGLATKKLQKKNCFVKNIEAIEKLGFITTICSDKTGTLTQSKMTAKFMWFNDSFRNIDSDNISKHLTEAPLRKAIEVNPLLCVAVLCNNTTFLDNRDNITTKKDW